MKKKKLVSEIADYLLIFCFLAAFNLGYTTHEESTLYGFVYMLVPFTTCILAVVKFYYKDD